MAGDLPGECRGGPLDPRRLRAVDGESRTEAGDAAAADVGVPDPADQVEQQAFAQRAVGDLHRVGPERLERRGEDRDAAGEDRRPLGVEAGKPLGE